MRPPKEKGRDLRDMCKTLKPKRFCESIEEGGGG
jgi:hypothetical protein